MMNSSNAPPGASPQDTELPHNCKESQQRELRWVQFYLIIGIAIGIVGIILAFKTDFVGCAMIIEGVVSGVLLIQRFGDMEKVVNRRGGCAGPPQRTAWHMRRCANVVHILSVVCFAYGLWKIIENANHENTCKTSSCKEHFKDIKIWYCFAVGFIIVSQILFEILVRKVAAFQEEFMIPLLDALEENEPTAEEDPVYGGGDHYGQQQQQQPPQPMYVQGVVVSGGGGAPPYQGNNNNGWQQQQQQQQPQPHHQPYGQYEQANAYPPVQQQQPSSSAGHPQQNTYGRY